MNLFVVFSFLFLSVDAYGAQKGVVITDGAIVYKRPDFDSRVIGYFNSNRKVTMSSKKFGPFYRVRFKQGMIGYVSDVDVAPLEPQKGEKPELQDKREKKSPGLPPWRGLAVGPLFGFVRFSELISQQELSSQVSVMGVQFSFPFRLIEGPFSLATSFLWYSGAPSYYSNFSTTEPKGSLYFLESILNFSVANFHGASGSVSLGAGPLLAHSSINATIGGRSQDLVETKLGVSIAAGVSYRWKMLVGKVEGRYFVEKANYPGFVAGLLWAFK